MVNFNGISPSGGVTGPGSSDPRRTVRPEDAASSDAAEFSAQSVSRADTQRIIEASAGQEDIRAELVERARQDIAEGTHRIQEIVEQVAATLTRFVG